MHFSENNINHFLPTVKCNKRKKHFLLFPGKQDDFSRPNSYWIISSHWVLSIPLKK